MRVIEEKKPTSIEEAIKKCLESGKAFRTVKVFKSRPNVFHTEEGCTLGNNIELKNIRCGRGPAKYKRTECDECEGIRKKRAKKKTTTKESGPFLH